MVGVRGCGGGGVQGGGGQIHFYIIITAPRRGLHLFSNHYTILFKVVHNYMK